MASLEKTPRLRDCDPRGKPYWHEIKVGLSVGYRRPLAGAGTWSVRWSDGKGGNKPYKFATADDLVKADGITVLTFDQACNRARELAGGAGAKADLNTGKMVTIFEAIDNYETDVIRRKAHKSNATHLRFNMTDVLGNKPVGLCVENDFMVWRNRLVDRGLTIGSADRLGRSLKATCNLAARADKRITNSAEWRNALTKWSDDDDSVRNVILFPETGLERKLIDTAYATNFLLGLWCHILSDTGSRESQCKALNVCDMQGATIMMWTSRKGKNRKRTQRPLPISLELAAILKQHVAGKSPNSPLLQPVNKLAKRFRRVTKALGLNTIDGRETAGLHGEDEITPYAFRHSSIVRRLLANINIRLVASAHDTSVAIIEKTYSKYIVSKHTEDLLRTGMLTPPLPVNVVSISANRR